MKEYAIVLADDHVMMREGIKTLINAAKGLKVIAEAGDGLELLKLLKKTTPDMVVLDISMPGLRGFEAAKEIRDRYPDIQILFLSMHKSSEFLFMALEAGAQGYLLKDDTAKELLRAIEEIRNGRTYLSPKLSMEFPTEIIGICRGDHKAAPSPLTHRERQILKLIAEGNSDRQISEKLFISLRTAQRHRFNIRTKLSLKSTADLVRYAITKGYTTSTA
ncbi:MAG: response regulator transcription factor [Desulfobacterales bacterium]|jgi:DNA-binding NarL/FixJ family response regulator|nr:response regulator transcription factor [Desulfobacterales bacterium]